MARISAIPRERAATVLRSLYDEAERRFGLPANLFRTLAHRPELLITFANFYRELWSGGVLDARTRHLAALRVAHLNGSPYGIAHRRAAARREGLSEAALAALAGDAWEQAGGFREPERAAIRLAEQLMQAPGSVTDDEVRRLRTWFGEAHLVELALLVGTANLLDRFALFGGLEPEPASR